MILTQPCKYRLFYQVTLCSPFQLGRGKLLAPGQLLNLVVPCAFSCTASIGMDPRGVLACLPVSFRLMHCQLAPFIITISRIKQFLCFFFGIVSPSSRPRRIINPVCSLSLHLPSSVLTLSASETYLFLCFQVSLSHNTHSLVYPASPRFHHTIVSSSDRNVISLQITTSD